MESSAFRVLREQVVPRLAEAVDVQAALCAATGRLPDSLELAVAHQQLKLLLLRERNLLEIAAERGYGGQLRRLLHELDKERDKLEAEVAVREAAQATFIGTITGLAESADNLVTYYDGQSGEQKAVILRLLIRRVTLPTNGQRGAAHRFLKAEWEPAVGVLP